ncbi:Transcriptional regulator of ribosomal biogenesis proteins [Linderina macrospora]|uniref:Transcriptional regulator of ribosomal biogenesis proteins n=1 Tax=Linderina macrospora TaxID=4868 RepID=A0ACC1JCM1_9FUNG|nr:Transcriptional regulator of ribosomal biogenesis proteins [Linderina macrospora]
MVDEDFYYPRDLEASFCRDFSCCGLVLNDLHDLLQHYEECHVRFEDDEAQADLADDCFFDDEWASADCLVDAPAATDLSGFGLTLEQQLILNAATTATSTAVCSPALSPVAAPGNISSISPKVTTGTTHSTTSSARNTPPLSPSHTASSSAISSPQETSLSYPSIDAALAGGRKRGAAADNECTATGAIKKQATLDGAKPVATSVDLSFASTALGLYDDDIIAALASATDPLFLSSVAAAAAGQDDGDNAKRANNAAAAAAVAASTTLAQAASAAVAAVAGDDSDDEVHLPPSVTAAMAGAVAAAAAAKAHGLLPRDDKPYRCPVSGCDKAYKNPNGLKYHNLHGHCSMGEEALGVSKPYKCRVPDCYKAYKNLNGLKYHVQHAHCAMIPSIRDLPPNATPAEVAAAVAAAAAAAAAAASNHSNAAAPAPAAAARLPPAKPIAASVHHSPGPQRPVPSAVRGPAAVAHIGSRPTQVFRTPQQQQQMPQRRPMATPTGPRPMARPLNSAVPPRAPAMPPKSAAAPAPRATAAPQQQPPRQQQQQVRAATATASC